MNNTDKSGTPAAYKVMRRERPEGPWEEVATAVITEATLVEQPRGKELEYRIVAVNKAGNGEQHRNGCAVKRVNAEKAQGKHPATSVFFLQLVYRKGQVA